MEQPLNSVIEILYFYLQIYVCIILQRDVALQVHCTH